VWGVGGGYGITLVAETTNKGDVFMSEEVVPGPPPAAPDPLRSPLPTVADHCPSVRCVRVVPGVGDTSVPSLSPTPIRRPAGAGDPAAMAAAQLSPEDMGALAAKRLLDQLCAGGAVDHAHQALALLFMALDQEGIGGGGEG